MKSLREQFLEGNPDLTSKQRMAWEFYCDIQEMCRDNPNWVEEVTELLEQVKKANQFKSSSPEPENV